MIFGGAVALGGGIAGGGAPAGGAPPPSCRQPWMPLDAPAFCPWRSEAPLPTPTTYAAVAASRDSIYVLGGYRYDAATNRVIYYDSVWRGRLGADGAIAAWAPQPRFQTARSGLGAARLGRCLFVAGGSYFAGATAVYADDTQSAAIARDGSVGAWHTSAHRLVTPRSNHTLLGLETPGGPYLYAIAGVTQIGADTVHLDTVEVARVEPDCRVGPWAVASYHLRGGRSTPQALAIRGAIVAIGGWGDLDLLDVFDDVQVAVPRADGAPSPWRTALGRLPTGSYGHATAYAAPRGAGSPLLLSVGGQPGTGAYGTWIAYAYVARGLPLPDAIGAWRVAPSGQLAVGRAGHGAVIRGDRLYVLGGSAVGGAALADVRSARFDAGAPQPPRARAAAVAPARGHGAAARP